MVDTHSKTSLSLATSLLLLTTLFLSKETTAGLPNTAECRAYANYARSAGAMGTLGPLQQMYQRCLQSAGRSQSQNYNYSRCTSGYYYDGYTCVLEGNTRCPGSTNSCPSDKTCYTIPYELDNGGQLQCLDSSDIAWYENKAQEIREQRAEEEKERIKEAEERRAKSVREALERREAEYKNKIEEIEGKRKHLSQNKDKQLDKILKGNDKKSTSNYKGAEAKIKEEMRKDSSIPRLEAVKSDFNIENPYSFKLGGGRALETRKISRPIPTSGQSSTPPIRQAGTTKLDNNRVKGKSVEKRMLSNSSLREAEKIRSRAQHQPIYGGVDNSAKPTGPSSIQKWIGGRSNYQPPQITSSELTRPFKRKKAASDLPVLELSSRAYHDPSNANGRPPSGWKALEIKTDRKTGFRAVTYQRKSDGKVVVSIAGTNKWSVRDWSNDAAAARGQIPKQFDQAREYIKTVRKKYGNADCTGHSLGGGACAYAAASLPAGTHGTVLNPITPGYLVTKPTSRVDNYVVDGDVARQYYGNHLGKNLIGNVYRVEDQRDKHSSNLVGKKKEAIEDHMADRALDNIAKQAGISRQR